MQLNLALTGLFMGLAGGPHCVVMCGAACAAMTGASDEKKGLRLALFQLGRILGYSGLGALAAGSLQGLGWLTLQSAALRPVWAFVHVAAIVLGLVLLIQARQPVWLEGGARRVWQGVRNAVTRRGSSAALFMGCAWALLPCGLLYSALMVAALAGRAELGALVMCCFALGTAVSMSAGPWLWLRLRGSQGAWGMRLAGAALVATSSWALWMALARNAAPWCVAPA